MEKSDARFKYEAKMGREDHNLSQPLGFTSAPGMLLPIWFDFATPGDSYYMQHDLPLLRSIQLLAPSMVDVKVHYETFFVPIQMIFQPAENTFFSLKNLQSSNYNPSNLLNNLFPCVDYNQVVIDYKTAADETLHDAFRLADLLGLAPQNFAPYGLTPYQPNFFPWQICAYHTIFEYYYRLDDKSDFNNINCNLDKYYDSSVFSATSSLFMAIHQRPWDFDYFTSMYRSPIVSDANMQKVLPFGAYNDLMPNAQQQPVSDIGTVPSNNSDIRSFTTAATNSYSANALQVSLSSLAVRQLFANEKLSMITGRTRKNYDSQVLAHYGVNVPHDVKHDLTMIHHDEYDLTVQEVTSLANTTDSPLGELAGKSFSAGNGKQFKFTAPCHGVIMTIFSIEPKKRYVTGFDRINAVSNAFDFPIPEFDRLGNVPMYRYEVGYRTSIGPQRTNTDIIGWKERYYQFKRKPARCTMAFFSNNGVNDWGSYFLSGLPFGELTRGASLSPSGDPRPDLESRFYIERGAVDAMCALPYFSGWKAEEQGENWNNSPWQAYARDPFIVNSHIKCKKVSWMSKDGEPLYVY